MSMKRSDYAEQEVYHPHAPMVPNYGMPDVMQPEPGDIHVVIDGTVATTTGAAQFGSYYTIVLSPAGAAEVIPLDPDRQFAYVTAVDSPLIVCTTKEAAQASANFTSSTTAPVFYGSTSSPAQVPQVTAPVAGTGEIFPGSGFTGIPAGTYTVEWTVMLGGTVTAAEANNFNLRTGANLGASATFLGSVNPGVAGIYPQEPFTVTFAAATGIFCTPYVAPGAAAVYSAWLMLTPVGATSPVTTTAANPQGYYLGTGMTTPPIRHNEPVWCANTSAAVSRVAVIIERGNIT